jgi:hypothetical protein
MEDIVHSKFLRFISFLFSDLPVENQWFNILYFNRNEELRNISTVLELSRDSGNNVMLVGRRGAGKTSLIKKFINARMAKDLNYVEHYLDLREIPLGGGSRTEIDDVVVTLNRILKSYLEEMGVVTSSQGNKHDLYSELCFALKHVDSEAKEKFKPLLLIIDDVDYTSVAFQEDLLRKLRPLFCFNSMVVLYAVRPEAERTARGHGDNETLGTIFRRISWIYLHTLDAGGVINERLGILSRRGGVKRFYDFLLTKVKHDFQFDEVKSHADNWEYPLTRNQEVFLTCISNGNILNIVTMAKKIINYIYENKDTLEKHKERGYIVGLSAILEIFDIKNVNESSKAIVDIMKPRSKKGNSLYRNIMESILASGRIAEGFYSDMAQLGHNKTAVNEALVDLRDDYEMIEPDYYSRSVYSRDNDHEIIKYVLSPRGRYYLMYLSNRKEYINKFGISKNSVKGYLYKDRLIEYLVEFIRCIYEISSFEDDSIKISQKKSYQFFLTVFPEIFDKADPRTPETPSLALGLDFKGFRVLWTSIEGLGEGEKTSTKLFSKEKSQRRSKCFLLYKSRVRKLMVGAYGGLKFDLGSEPVGRYVKFLSGERVKIKPKYRK